MAEPAICPEQVALGIEVVYFQPLPSLLLLIRYSASPPFQPSVNNGPGEPFQLHFCSLTFCFDSLAPA